MEPVLLYDTTLRDGTQGENINFTAEEKIRIARRLDVPLSQVYGVSTFYSHFTDQPRGEYTIRVCMGTACYVRGGPEILKRLSQMLGIGVGDTTPDRKFTLEVMRCIGACGLAPAITVNDEVIRQVNPDKLHKIIELCD